MNAIRKIAKSWRGLIVTGLLLWICYAIVVVNEDMKEHGFWQVYGEPDYRAYISVD